MSDPATAWWQSKKLFVVGAHHSLVFGGALAGTIYDHAAAPTLFGAAIAAISAVTLGHNVSQSTVDRAQAYSPNFPYPGAGLPQQPQSGQTQQASAGSSSNPPPPGSPADANSTVPAPSSSGIKLPTLH